MKNLNRVLGIILTACIVFIVLANAVRVTTEKEPQTTGIDVLTGFTYSVDEGEVYMLNEAHQTYYYIGFIRFDSSTSGDFVLSLDNGLTETDTNIGMAYSDIWEDEPREIKIFRDGDVLGYLTESGIGTNDYFFIFNN